MKKRLLLLLFFACFQNYAQERTYGVFDQTVRPKKASKHSGKTFTGCNVNVVNDTAEENGIFINGIHGQKAAVDIPIASNVQMTITQVKVTLASKLPPTFANLRFYENAYSTPSNPNDAAQQIPGETRFDVETVIAAMDTIGYEPDHEFYIRRITLALPSPVTLFGNQVSDRYWMGVISDARAWATANPEYQEVLGEFMAAGGDSFAWFQYQNTEGQYELTAECINLPDPCSYGVWTENSGVAVNVATGGALEYAGAADFMVAFGKVLTVNQATINILKGEAGLSSVNVKLWNEAAGFPNEVIASFENLVPASQELEYEIEPGFSSYKITLNFPESRELQSGKYFLQVSAVPGDSAGAWWETTHGLQQSLGVFDYVTYDQGVSWGGSGYGDYVFSMMGSCSNSGEVLPDYGSECVQGDVTNQHEDGIDLLIQRVADDFIVAEDTVFNLTHVDMDVLSMGPGINNATINFRNSADGAPGDIIHTVANIGPTQEQFFDYWPWTGFPPMIPALKWYFDFDAVALTSGKYFIEVLPNPYYTEALLWETTSQAGNGDFSYSSPDGVSWTINEGYNQVFNVGGFCQGTLGLETSTRPAGFVGYPNPVNDILNISTLDPIENIAVYNLLGQLMAFYDMPANTVDMTALSPGTYLLKVQGKAGAIQTVKIIKN